MLDENKALVRRHFEEMWNERNLDAADEIMAADYTENAAAPFGTEAPGKVNGPMAMKQTIGWLTSQFSDIKMEIEALIAEGDLVAVRILSTGTNDGKLNGMMPPTGKKFSARQSHWFRVVDGKLAEHWATRDDLTGMIQIGVINPPGPPR